MTKLITETLHGLLLLCKTQFNNEIMFFNEKNNNIEAVQPVKEDYKPVLKGK
jgi:hypothetical protein